MNVIIKPLVSEKMTKMTENHNRYGFIVNKKANKIEIKKSVEELYGVTVISVNTVLQMGKNLSRYTKKGFIQGRQSTTKKAFVQIKQGEVIDFYSNI